MEKDSSTTFSAVHDAVASRRLNTDRITLRQYVIMGLVCAVLISDIVIAYAILTAEGLPLQRIFRAFSYEWLNDND